MPVNELQKNVAKRIFRSQINTASNLEELTLLYRSLVTLTPKGFRGSLLKRIDFPTSWAVLYGLSPAQISQNRESDSAREVFRPVRLGGVEEIEMWKTLLKAYFAGNPEPMSEADFPSWRAPRWMTDAEKQEINQLIRTLYVISTHLAEEPLDSTMPVEEVSADEEVIAEMSANMDGEEETVVVEESTQTASPNVRQADLFESLYALYRGYFRLAHGIMDAEGLRREIAPNGDMREGNTEVRRSALGIIALEKLGYEYTSVKGFLVAITNRGFQIAGVRVPRKRDFGAYVTVDLKAFSSQAYSPRRYTSRNAYLIMQSACRVLINQLEDQFNRPNGRGLQVFRFSGRGSRMVGVQVLSLNYMNAIFENNGMTYEEAVRKINSANAEATENLRNAVSSTETASTASASSDSTADAQAQAERQASRASGISGAEDNFYYIGYQKFPSGLTFRRHAPLYYDLAGLNTDEGEFSYTFYFASPRDGVYKLYRSVFSPMRIVNVTSLDGSGLGLKYYWNNSGQLDALSRLNLQEVPLLNRRQLRQMIVGAHDNTRTYTSSTTMLPDRNGGERVNVDFDKIKRIGLIEPAFTDNLRGLESSGSTEPQNDELASGTSVNDAETNERVARSVKAIKTQKIDRTFAYEIEGDMAYPNSRGENKQAVLASSIDKVLEERGIQRGYRWDINHDPRLFTITLKGDGSVEGKRPFEIDTPVFIPENVDLAKTNIDNAVSQTQFNKYKWDSDANMWQWVSVFSEALLESSVRIHKSAGLHIHISATDYNDDDFKRYLENYAGFEKVFDLMMPINSRKGGRSYNSSIIQRGKINTGYQRGGGTPSPTPEEWRRTGRTGRSKVRTTTGIGTIEFRHPMTNIEGDLIKHFIILAYSLVEVSKIKKFDSFKFKDLQSFLPDATATFLFNRIEDLSQQDLSQEDARQFFGDGRGTRTELQRRNLA